MNREFLGHGYPAHFIIGLLMAGLVFHWIFKKTDDQLRSWIAAVAIVSAIGLAKELIDPYINRQRDILDLAITSLGGVMGATSILGLRKM